MKSGELDSEALLDEVKDVLWKTRGGGAPLRRFLNNPTSDFSGFFGRWENLPEEFRTRLEKIGIEPPNSITGELAEEYIEKISGRASVDIDKEIWEHLRKANSIIIESRQNFNGCSFLTYDDSWIVVADDKFFLQLTHDEYRFGDLNKRILHPDQFPPGINSLRELYQGEYQLELIDNEIDMLTEISSPNDTEINILRLLKSLKLDFKVEYSEEKSLHASFCGDPIYVPYLISDINDEIQISLSSDRTQWTKEVATFLVGQTDRPLSLIEVVRKALESSSSNEFDQFYSRLSDEGMDIFGRGAVECEVAETDGLSEDDSRPTVQPEKTPVIREPTIDTSPDVEENEKTKTKKSSKSEKAAQKKENITVKKRREEDQNIRKEIADERKRIGDEAERIVKEDWLERQGWSVINRNEFYGKAVEGSDIVAENGSEKRIIAVKGTKGDWNGKRSISWKQAVHALQYHDPEDLYGRGKVTCWLYVVEKVFDENPIIAEIDWCRKKPEFDFPQEWKGNLGGEEE